MNQLIMGFLCFLFFFSGFASPGNIIREAIERTTPSIDGILSQSSKQMYDEFARALEHIVDIPENATKQEVFEKFKEVFVEVERSGHDVVEEGYIKLIFGKWWEDVDFRAIMFDTVSSIHIEGRPDLLLKWWKQAKDMGIGETKLLKLTSEAIDDLGDGILGLLKTILAAVRMSEEFATDWMSVIRNNDFNIVDDFENTLM